MTKLISFGSYTFADSGARWRDNFAQVAAHEIALPGLNGALDADGSGVGVNVAGRIDVALWLKQADVTAMNAARDALKGLLRAGAQRLTIESAPDQQRYTRARVLTIDMPEVYAQRTDTHQETALTFAAVTPRWFSVTPPVGSGTAYACSGAQTDFTRTANGSAFAYPTITVTATSGVTTLTIQRLDGALVADQITYAGAIPDGATLIIDPCTWGVTLNGADAYGSAFSALHPAWFRLPPGAHTIRVALNTGATADIALRWDDTWY